MEPTVGHKGRHSDKILEGDGPIEEVETLGGMKALRFLAQYWLLLGAVLSAFAFGVRADDKIDQHDIKIEAIGKRLDTDDASILELSKQGAAVNSSLTSQDKRLESMDKKIDTLLERSRQ